MDRFALTTLVAAPGTPITFEDRHAALRFTLAKRDRLHLLGNTWTTSGVYVRLARDASGVLAYVGQARDLLRRAEQHSDDQAIQWSHILLAARTSTPFDEAEFTYLEGAVHDRLRESGYRLKNAVQPGSDRLSDWDKEALAAVVIRVWWMLAALGWDADDTGTLPAPTVAAGTATTDAALGRAYPVVEDVTAALAEKLTLQRAARGTASTRRAILIGDHIVGEQEVDTQYRNTCRITLDAARIAAATGWPLGVVRAGLGARMNRQDGDGDGDRYWWGADGRSALKMFVGEFGLPFGRDVQLTDDNDPGRKGVDHDPDVAAACTELLAGLNFYPASHFRDGLRVAGRLVGTTRYGNMSSLGAFYQRLDYSHPGVELHRDGLQGYGWSGEVERRVWTWLSARATTEHGPGGGTFVAGPASLDAVKRILGEPPSG